MKLFAWTGATSNFGDALNHTLWPALLPDFFDGDEAERFIGIGSVLDDRHPAAPRKIVAGAGYGGYGALPRLDERWVIHWVRGPDTARALGLPTDRALGDPAMLVRAIAPPRSGEAATVGFMPHFESLRTGAWAEAASAAGVTLIDPRDEPARVLGAIRDCRLLVCEAMHGAIVADALRVPWVALAPVVPAHRAKWQDWAGSLALDLAFQRLPPSSLYEGLRASGLARRRRLRQAIDRMERPLRRAGRDRFVARAAAALAEAAAAPPQLSTDRALDRALDRMLVCLHHIGRNPREAVRPR